MNKIYIFCPNCLTNFSEDGKEAKVMLLIVIFALGVKITF